MISRRSFLKLSGLTAVAIGAGAGTGYLYNTAGTQRCFAMHGFVPGDRRIAAAFLQAFVNELPEEVRGLTPTVHADGQWHDALRAGFRGNSFSSGPVFEKGRITLRMTALAHTVPADVLVFDERKNMYIPERDFNGSLSEVRGMLQGAQARYQLSAVYDETPPLASLLSRGRVVVVENERGIVDRIPLRGKQTLRVTGPQGATGVTITDAAVLVHSSTCRHSLCRQGIASAPGDVIACAPNRVLLRIEMA
jgi:hypothetical protein